MGVARLEGKEVERISSPIFVPLLKRNLPPLPRNPWFALEIVHQTARRIANSWKSFEAPDLTEDEEIFLLARLYCQIASKNKTIPPSKTHSRVYRAIYKELMKDCPKKLTPKEKP